MSTELCHVQQENMASVAKLILLHLNRSLLNSSFDTRCVPCRPQKLKEALAAEQAARAALAGELAKLKGRAGGAEGRRGGPVTGKENVGARV